MKDCEEETLLHVSWKQIKKRKAKELVQLLLINICTKCAIHTCVICFSSFFMYAMNAMRVIADPSIIQRSENHIKAPNGQFPSQEAGVGPVLSFFFLLESKQRLLLLFPERKREEMYQKWYHRR